MNARGWWVGLGTVAVGALGIYFWRLYQFGEQLVVTPRIEVYKVTLDGIMLRVNVTLKNPTSSSVMLQHPFVEIFHEGSLVATSKTSNAEKVIQKSSETKLDPIEITVSLASLPDILTRLMTTDQLSLEVVTRTKANNITLPPIREYITIAGIKGLLPMRR